MDNTCRKQNMKEGNEEKKNEETYGKQQMQIPGQEDLVYGEQEPQEQTKANIKNIIQGTFHSIKQILIQISEVTLLKRNITPNKNAEEYHNKSL